MKWVFLQATFLLLADYNFCWEHRKQQNKNRLFRILRASLPQGPLLSPIFPISSSFPHPSFLFLLLKRVSCLTENRVRIIGCLSPSSFPLSFPIPSQCLKTGNFRGSLGDGEGQEGSGKGRGFLKGGARSQQWNIVLLLSFYLSDFFLFLIRHIFSGSDFGWWWLLIFHFFSFSFWEMDGKGGG